MTDNPYKTRNQLRRAHKLLDVIDGLAGHLPNETRLAFAQGLPVAKWADIALLAGITVPSVTTAAMVIGLLETRITNETLAADDVFMAFAGMDR